MDRFMKLVLGVISLYLVFVLVIFIRFDMKVEEINGIWVSIYILVFTLSFIALTFVYGRDINKYLAYPLYGLVVIGIKTFYDIFIDISDLPISVVKYDFNYYLFYTHFSIESFQFKTSNAISYLIVTLLACVVGLYLYFNSIKQEKTTE